jgi:hypothetical protein
MHLPFYFPRNMTLEGRTPLTVLPSFAKLAFAGFAWQLAKLAQNEFCPLH